MEKVSRLCSNTLKILTTSIKLNPSKRAEASIKGLLLISGSYSKLRFLPLEISFILMTFRGTLKRNGETAVCGKCGYVLT